MKATQVDRSKSGDVALGILRHTYKDGDGDGRMYSAEQGERAELEARQQQRADFGGLLEWD